MKKKKHITINEKTTPNKKINKVVKLNKIINEYMCCLFDQI